MSRSAHRRKVRSGEFRSRYCVRQQAPTNGACGWSQSGYVRGARVSRCVRTHERVSPDEPVRKQSAVRRLIRQLRLFFGYSRAGWAGKRFARRVIRAPSCVFAICLMSLEFRKKTAKFFRVSFRVWITYCRPPRLTRSGTRIISQRRSHSKAKDTRNEEVL